MIPNGPYLLVLMTLNNLLPLILSGICDFLLTNIIWQKYVMSLLYRKDDGCHFYSDSQYVRSSLEIILADLMKQAAILKNPHGKNLWEASRS